MIRQGLIALAIGLHLAACGALPESKGPPAPPPAETAAPSPAPAAPPKPSTPAVPKSALVPPPPKPALKPPSEPEELVGLDEEGVRKLLGTPGDVRNDGAARVLTYHAGSCELEIFLFMDVKAGNLRVLSYQLNDTRTHATQSRPCYDDLRSER
jgi:hypothetical protein